MLHPINVLANPKEKLEEIYLNSISEFVRRTYYRPHILVTAESGAGKSTLISRLSSKKMRKVLKLEIGKIRSTACTAKHIFDPELPKNIFGVSVTQKLFGKIRDDITAILIAALAAKLLEYNKVGEDADIAQIVKALYDAVFTRNDSLFNFTEICEELDNTAAIDIIQERLEELFLNMVEEKYVEDAKLLQEQNTNKAKKFTLKVFLEEIIARNISEGVEHDCLDTIFTTVEMIVEQKVSLTFQRTSNKYRFSVFNVDNQLEEATQFMKKLFGTSNDPKANKNKGIQYFLDEVWIHVPTNEVYQQGKSFVVIDTEGLTHRSNKDEDIQGSFMKLVNCNRINHVIFMTPFATDVKVFNVIRDSINTLKKKWNVSIFLPKYDEFVTSETVANGEDLEEEEDKKIFFEEHIEPMAERAVASIEQSIKVHNATSKNVKFEERVRVLSFGDNKYVEQTTSKELYDIISEILEEIEKQNITIPVKAKAGIEIDTKDVITFDVDLVQLNQECNQIVSNNQFVKSLKALSAKKPYWTSVYTLKDKISYGNGHTTNAEVYDNFSIYPASGVETGLKGLDLKRLIKWNFNSLESVPVELQSKLMEAIEGEFRENVCRKLAITLTYTKLTEYFYGQSMYYLDWYRGLLKLYQVNLSNSKYWADEVQKELMELVKVKIEDLVDVQFS